MTTAAVLNAYKLQLHMLLLALVPACSAAIDTATGVTNSVGGNNASTASSFLAVLAIVLGLLCGFAGYRFLRPVTASGGFIAGGYCVAYAFEQAAGNANYVPVVSWLAFIIGGLVVGGALFMVYPLTVLFAGASSGFVLAFIVYAIFGFEIYPANPIRVLQISAAVLCVLGALLAWKRERPMLVATTSFVGAGRVLYGIGFFAGQFPNGSGIAKVRAAFQYKSWWEAIPGAWWGYLTAFIALFTICMIVQFEVTSPPRRRVDSFACLTDDRSRSTRSARSQFADYELSPV
jgi:hypothetical protein